MPQNYTLHKKQIQSIKSVAEGVFVLSFVRDFDFVAGQVIAIDIVSDGQPRLYSIASGEQDKNISILFDERPAGKLTPLLSKLKSGDYIYVSKPFGTFCSDVKPAYWIASGTGIAPFVSMIRSGLGENKVLLQGARNDSDFYFATEFETSLNDNYIRCCSQQSDTQYYVGRLTKWLTEQTDLPKNCSYNLCGSPEMVVQVRDILISKGIDFKNIISETYF